MLGSSSQRCTSVSVTRIHRPTRRGGCGSLRRRPARVCAPLDRRVCARTRCRARWRRSARRLLRSRARRGRSIHRAIGWRRPLRVRAAVGRRVCMGGAALLPRIRPQHVLVHAAARAQQTRGITLLCKGRSSCGS
jgi:hypothetical protein